MNFLELQISLLAFYGYMMYQASCQIPKNRMKTILVIVFIEGQYNYQHYDCTHRHTFTNLKKQLLNCHRKSAYFSKYSNKTLNEPPFKKQFPNII